METQEKTKETYTISHVAIDVSVTSFMTVIATFFTGFLISNYSSYDMSIRIPILFLITSTFALLYTTNIFGNASGELMAGHFDKAKRHGVIATIISEFLGVYLLVTSIPLAVNAITSDSFLRLTVFIVAITGLGLYSSSHFSIIERYIRRPSKRYLYSAALSFASLACFICQIYAPALFVPAALFLIMFLASTTLALIKAKQYY